MTDHGQAAHLARRAMHTLAELVGCPAEGVTGIRRDDENWIVVVEVLEVERVPETADVLASYEVQVDGDGDVQSFQRVRRYQRAQTEGV